MTDYTPVLAELRAAYFTYRGFTGRSVEIPLLDAEFARGLAKVQADALREAAVIRAEMLRDELAMADLAYEGALPQPSQFMLNGATRFAERLLARADTLHPVIPSAAGDETEEGRS